MATQSEMAPISPPAVARAQDVSKSQAADPNTTQETQETDLAWELVKDECHDVLEQLPLTLQRNYALMRDLDEQVAAHLQAIPTVLHEYIELRKQLTQDVIMADAQTNGELDGHGGVEHQSKRAASRASFSSASLTPITDSPSTRSLSIPNPRRGRNNFSPDGIDEEETEEPETSFESQAAPAVKPTSTELIARIATLATDAVRGSLEKVNLSNAAFASIDRHVRALDIAIAEQERAIAVGIRPGTRPAAIAIPETTSPTHTHSQSYESNNLFALAEVASAVHAAEKTLESLQPPPSAISTTISMWNDNEQEKPEEKPEEKPVVNEVKKRAETVKNTEPKPKQQQPKREKKSSKKKAAAAAAAAAAPPPVYEPEKEPTPDPDEPRYCYCDRVSFGNMIACDGPNCKREWFHWECVGITRAPSTNKWFCRDCEVREPAKKKRKR